MFNYLLYRIGQAIALSIPLKVGYRIAIFISDLLYIFNATDRKAVTENLKVIFPEKSDNGIGLIRRKMFRNFAKYLVDFFRLSALDSEYIKKNIKIENIGYLDESLSKGRGVIALTAHLGNWELGGAVMGLLGYPFWAVALQHKNKKVNKFFNYQRQSKGERVIPFGNAARQCLNLLKENKIVALVGDRDFSEKGIKVDFLGKQTFLPLGPAAFSLKVGATIVPGFMLRNSDDTFTLKFDTPIEFAPSIDKDGSGDDNNNLLKIISIYKVIIEDYIRKYPDQWYMFRRFWIS